VFGHSYWQLTFGTRSQQGRADGYLRALLDVQTGTNYSGHAAAGVRLSVEGDSGYARIMQLITGPAAGGNINYTAPYTISGMGGTGGAFVLGWGINDLGYNGNTVQENLAYQQAMRFAISRCRISTLGASNKTGWNGCGTIAYSGWAFNASPSGRCTGPGNYYAATAGSTITITLPSDFSGETVSLCFASQPGGSAGSPTSNVMTLTGTALTGTTYSGTTFNTACVQPSATLSYTPVCKRLIGLPSSAAGKTIIITYTTIDPGGSYAYFDSWWLEAREPPPIIVCNTARLLNSPNGYGAYTTGIGDNDVEVFNTYLPPVVAEFDGMVQIADLDGAMAKDPNAFCYDGLHPNERGAVRCATAVVTALLNCTPNNTYTPTASMITPSQASAPVVKPLLSGQVYTSETFGGATTALYGSTITMAVGDTFAIPFYVSPGVAVVTNWVMETTAGSVAPTVFFNIYDDRQYIGYPQFIHQNPANSTALSLNTGASVFTSTTTSGNNGYLSWSPDPGMYWLVVKFVTTGTSATLRTLKGPCAYMPNLLSTGGGGTSPSSYANSPTPVGWYLSGQGTAAMGNRFPSGAIAVDNAPMIGLKIQ
jgi:hypothetical protein